MNVSRSLELFKKFLSGAFTCSRCGRVYHIHSFGFGSCICPDCYHGETQFLFPDRSYLLNRLVFPVRSLEMKLSLNQRIHLKIFGHAFVETKPHPVTGKDIDYYVVRCEEHGLQVTYPMGHSQRLPCPVCLEEDGISFPLAHSLKRV